jgi:hypothetical protein
MRPVPERPLRTGCSRELAPRRAAGAPCIGDSAQGRSIVAHSGRDGGVRGVASVRSGIVRRHGGVGWRNASASAPSRETASRSSDTAETRSAASPAEACGATARATSAGRAANATQTATAHAAWRQRRITEFDPPVLATRREAAEPEPQKGDVHGPRAHQPPRSIPRVSRASILDIAHPRVQVRADGRNQVNHRMMAEYPT